MLRHLSDTQIIDGVIYIHDLFAETSVCILIAASTVSFADGIYLLPIELLICMLKHYSDLFLRIQWNDGNALVPQQWLGNKDQMLGYIAKYADTFLTISEKSLILIEFILRYLLIKISRKYADTSLNYAEKHYSSIKDTPK